MRCLFRFLAGFYFIFLSYGSFASDLELRSSGNGILPAIARPKEFCTDVLGYTLSFNDFIDSKNKLIRYGDWLKWVNTQGLSSKQWLMAGIEAMKGAVAEGYKVCFPKWISDKHLASKLLVENFSQQPLKISFSGYENLSAKSLLKFAKKFRYLKELEIDNYQKLLPKEWKNFVSYLPNLELISLAGNEGITDGVLALLGRKSGKLRSLFLNRCPKITSGGLKQIARRNPKVEHLDITLCNNLKTDDLVFTVHCFKNLKSFHCMVMYPLGNEVILELSKCSQLRSLALFELDKPAEDSLVALLSSCPLEYLILPGIQFSVKMVKGLEKNCSLKTFYVNDVSALSPEDLKDLVGRNKGLYQLCLGNLDDADIVLEGITKKHSNLHCLSFPGCKHMDGEKFCETLLKLSCLQDLTLEIKDGLKDIHLRKMIKRVPHLKQLSIECPEISKQTAFQLFKQCGQLKKLFIKGLVFNDGLLGSLGKHCKQLTRLCIDGYGVTENGWATFLNACKNVKSLRLMNGRFKDSLLGPLFKHLESLFLVGCNRITEGGIKRLKLIAPALHVECFACKRVEDVASP